MTQTTSRKTQILLFPSSIGLASILFTLLFCMLTSSMLLNNPLIGGGLYLVSRVAVMCGKWLHPLKFHDLEHRQKQIAIVILAVVFVAASLLLIAIPIRMDSVSLWLLIISVFFLTVRPMLVRHALEGWIQKNVGPMPLLRNLVLFQLLLLIPPLLLFFLSANESQAWSLLFGYLVSDILETAELWHTRYQENDAVPLSSEEMTQLKNVYAYQTFSRIALVIAAAMQGTLITVYTFIGCTADEMLVCLLIAFLCTGVSYLLTGALMFFLKTKDRDPSNILFIGLLLWLSGLAFFSSNILSQSLLNAYLSIGLCTLGIGVSVRVLTGMEDDIRHVIEFALGHPPTQEYYRRLRFQIEFATLCGQLFALLGIALFCFFNQNAFPSTLAELAANIHPLMIVPSMLLVFAAFVCALLFPMTKQHLDKLDKYIELENSGTDNPALRAQLEGVIVRRSLKHYGVKIIMVILRPFFFHRIRGKENVPVNDDAVNVFVCNHGEIYGPIVTNLYVPFSFRPWVISEMMDKDAIAQRTADGTFTRWTWMPAKWRLPIARKVAPLIAWAMRSVDSIPVYYQDPMKLRRTFRESVTAMEAGDNILLFPENSDDMPDHRYALSGVSHFFTGFVMLGTLYYNKTGKRANFVPIYANKQKRVLTFGKPTRYDPDAPQNEERDRICEYLRNEMLKIASESAAKPVK
ncbi:MAG: hypothetical protein IJ240_04420 [Clostridia bacterium]|nr:hypothetical protein [Clostridia bacterium]